MDWDACFYPDLANNILLIRTDMYGETAVTPQGIPTPLKYMHLEIRLMMRVRVRDDERKLH
jgi:hypothetical protein